MVKASRVAGIAGVVAPVRDAAALVRRLKDKVSAQLAISEEIDAVPTPYVCSRAMPAWPG